MTDQTAPASTSDDVRRVLVLAHTGREEAREVARECVRSLTGHGIVVRLLAEEAEDLDLTPDSMEPALETVDAAQYAGVGCELALVIGGDGSILRAAEMTHASGTPLLGVNLGKVGFLSKAEAHELEAVLGQLAAGTYAVRERMGLAGSILAAGRPAELHFTALNDIVVARGALARVVRLDVTIDESHLATFVADGLVVSSPTGSTGYSFSAGGPILDPQSRNLVVTPIAGYLSSIRSIVSARRSSSGAEAIE